MPIEFGEKTRRIPVYPVAAGYDLGAEVAMLASNEAPFPPAESVQAAAASVLANAHRCPDPSYEPLRQALSKRYDIAPAITNLIGDTHDSGGVSGQVGVRFRFADRL